jgi:hypothetical protein
MTELTFLSISMPLELGILHADGSCATRGKESRISDHDLTSYTAGYIPFRPTFPIPQNAGQPRRFPRAVPATCKTCGSDFRPKEGRESEGQEFSVEASLTSIPNVKKGGGSN